MRLRDNGCRNKCMAAVMEHLSSSRVIVLLTCLQQRPAVATQDGSWLALELAGLPALQGSTSPIPGLVGAPQCLHCEATEGCPGKGPAL